MRGLTLLGTGASSGKSTLAVGLIALARMRGLEVTPFKPVAVVDLNDPSCPDPRPWLHAIYHHESAAGLEHRWQHNPVALVPDAPHGDGARGGRLYVRGEDCGRAAILAEDNIDFANLERDQRRAITEAVAEAVSAHRRDARTLVMEGSGALDQHTPEDDVVNRWPALAMELPVALVTKGWDQANHRAVARCLTQAGALREFGGDGPLLRHVIVNGIERPADVRAPLDEYAERWGVHAGGVVEKIRYPSYDDTRAARQTRYGIVAEAVRRGFVDDLMRRAFGVPFSPC